MSIESLTAFLGWSLIINTLLLLLTTAAIAVLRERVVRIHAQMFAVNEEDLPKIYFSYLANYKLLILFFNLIPYITLKIIY